MVFVVSSSRILRGPSTRDRLTALLLLSTTGAAALALLAEALDTPALRDAALAIVALATIIVFVRVSAERRREAPPPGERSDAEGER
ncbi:hypothetical protein Rrhod_4465 [Rhodococcus rhodnii LMG 5362]|uniref:Uncharacterized protein n=1 Tax=Rhodococcus rhodnii LMG 5362 TaxID=1273125 RepID=R7WH01_9NOCA|nr:hypothetical protein Rrhod_4465 [Rhodococcus rhodnii LMG 5362]